jgi:methylated-DNA-protein-cysteine methyltransferase-like protein
MKLPSLQDQDRSFFNDVYDVVEQIPFGRVTSYGAIARYLSSGAAARTVGWAMNHSHEARPDLPAHRVVNRNGVLSGKAHFGSPGRMQELLEAEGVQVEEDRIVNFEEHFWDPSRELEL